MNKTLHHATVKRATKLGVRIHDANEDMFHLENIATGRFSNEKFSIAKESLDALEAGTITWERPSLNRCGVMVKLYHERYEHNGHGPGSCDGLDCAMRDAFTTESGVMVGPLQELGESLGLWNPSWSSLNPGMKRMNLSNRIRAFLRNNEDAQVTIAGQTSRFGVAFLPSKRKSRKA